MAAAAGVFLSKITTPLQETVNEIPKGPLYFLIAVAVVAVMISFLGCCGAAQENPCMLYTYGFVILMLLIAEVVCGGLIVGFRKDMNRLVKEGLYKAVEKYHRDQSYSPLDDIQHSLKCCGASNYSDWANYTTHHNGEFPESCCAANKPPCHQEDVFKKGCWTALETEFSYVSGVAAIVAIAVAIIQFVAVVGTCLLARAFRREYEVV